MPEMAAAPCHRDEGQRDEGQRDEGQRDEGRAAVRVPMPGAYTGTRPTPSSSRSGPAYRGRGTRLPPAEHAGGLPPADARLRPGGTGSWLTEND